MHALKVQTFSAARRDGLILIKGGRFETQLSRHRNADIHLRCENDDPLGLQGWGARSESGGHDPGVR